MVEHATVDGATRPHIPGTSTDTWVELVILPFDRRMAPESDDGWVQWAPEECRVLNSWQYGALCLLWPLLRLRYRQRLMGQATDR